MRGMLLKELRYADYHFLNELVSGYSFFDAALFYSSLEQKLLFRQRIRGGSLADNSDFMLLGSLHNHLSRAGIQSAESGSRHLS